MPRCRRPREDKSAQEASGTTCESTRVSVDKRQMQIQRRAAAAERERERERRDERSIQILAQTPRRTGLLFSCPAQQVPELAAELLGICTLTFVPWLSR